MSSWSVRDYDPEQDEAPEGDPEHDCDGAEPEDPEE